MLNPKKKGNDYEKEVAEEFKELDSTAGRNYSSGGGVRKSDVHNSLNYLFECKRVESLNIYKAIAQAERDASQSHATPAVVFRKNNTESYVAIPLWHFKDLIKKSREPKTASTDNQRLQWLIRTAVESLKRLLKEIEK